jgi:mannose-6-phosphate isomerase
MRQSPRQILGRLAPRFRRFPLLLKFLDVSRMLSVQVHPRDGDAELLPDGETGKTEAWVILESGSASRVYAGLKPGVTAADLRGISKQTADRYLTSFMPLAEQAVLIEAGTVHSVGGGTVVFEVQQNSDVTFRLYDWDHIDPRSGQPRPLQVEQALACIDFSRGAVLPVGPTVDIRGPTSREHLIDCSHFSMTRLESAVPFDVGATDVPRILVCLAGSGTIEYGDVGYGMEKGSVTLLPASLGVCRFRPDCAVTLLEIGIAENP